MLNMCPKQYSCGTANPYWTDGVAPTDVGVPANITAYMSYSSTGTDSRCKFENGSYNIQLEVMRCSLTEHDVVYKYIPSGRDHAIYHYTCTEAFCGMM